FHEILPGLGAFAITPDENGAAQGLEDLATFLEDVLRNLSNRASLRERRSSTLYEAVRERRALYGTDDTEELGGVLLQDAGELDADRLRLSAAEDIAVIVAWYDSEPAKKWMLHHKLVVLRLGRRRGTLPLIKSLSAASHILL